HSFGSAKAGPAGAASTARPAGSTRGATCGATSRAITDNGKSARGGRAPEGARSLELAHHDGRPVALDEPVVCRAGKKLAAGAVLLQRNARPHSVVCEEVADPPFCGTGEGRGQHR